MIIILQFFTPSYIDKLLKRNSEIHGRTTRHSNLNLVCPNWYKRKTEGGTAFTVKTIQSWNSINTCIRNKSSVSSFKINHFKSILEDQKATMLLKL